MGRTPAAGPTGPTAPDDLVLAAVGALEHGVLARLDARLKAAGLRGLGGGGP